MQKYEMMFIVRPDVEEDALQATREKLQTLIQKYEGEVTKVNDMGKRRLAYVIHHKQGNEPQKYREGYYTVFHLDATSEVVEELNRVINIDDKILRHLIINLEAVK